MTYNVKEASKKIQMSVHNIRYYTNLELVPSLKHDKHGNRVFDDESLNWLICIRFLREREIVHYQRFAEGLEYVKSQLNKKNYYAYNPSFTSSKREQTCE